MDRASLAPGARSLHSVIMLPETNAYIVDQLDKLISTTGGPSSIWKPTAICCMRSHPASAWTRADRYRLC